MENTVKFLKSVAFISHLIFYRLKFEYGKGYLLAKRQWLWYLFTPLFLPFFLIVKIIDGTIEYFNLIGNYWICTIRIPKKKLSIREIIKYHKQLLQAHYDSIS